MANYPISTRTIEINASGELNIIDRSTSSLIDTIDLTKLKANFSKSGTDFSVVGTSDDLEGASKFSDTALSENSVGLDTNFSLTNVGNEEDLSFISQEVQIRLVSGTLLEFWRAE